MPTYSVPLHVTASAIRRRIMMSAPPGNGYVIQSDSTADEGYSWVLAGGGGGTTNHAALNNLGWTYSGHTHTGTGIAGFNGVTATVYGLNTAGGVAAYNTTVASFGALTPVEGKWLGYSSGALTWSTPTAAIDWVTFVGQASNPGGASTTSTLYMSDGTEYDVGTLVWSRKTVFRDAMSIGEPGSEQADIKLGGVTYASPLKVNAFGTARAGCVLHQHSNTVEPDLVFARARGTTSSHTIVQDADIFGRIAFAGWLNSTIGYARGAEIRAHADGTISTTSMPTRIDFATCGVGTTTVTDRWCILPNGTFRPATDNTYQIGNTSYALTEAWARQWMLLEQAAVTAPAGGWAGRSGVWAKNETPTIPMFTDDAGVSAPLARVVDQISDPFAGYGDVTDPGWGRFWVSAAAATASPLTGAALGLWGQSSSTGAPSYSITYSSTTGYYLGWNTSTTTPRGPYAGSLSCAGTYDSLRKSRTIAVFTGATVADTRMFVGYAAWGAPEAITGATTSVLACVRFGFAGTAIHAICADGTTRSIATFTRTISDGEALAFEIVPGASSVTFNLYGFTPFSKTGRYSFIESATISTNLPSGSTRANWLIAAQSTAGTPQARMWGVCAASVLA